MLNKQLPVDRKKRNRKALPQKLESPKKLSTALSINGTALVGEYHFSCGNVVPIYEVDSVHAFNQIIGHAKFNNQAYGNVFYRGECKLHDSLKPSLYRNVKNVEKATQRISELIQNIVDDSHMRTQLKIDGQPFDIAKHKVEGLLQHYGIPTRFVDVVDNHWIALWMGLNRAEKVKQLKQYYHYTERIIPLVELANNQPTIDGDLFQYVILIAIPFSNRQVLSGIQIANDYIEVDLRQALPSIFLRPHAQHGFVVRKKVHNQDYCKGTDAYDIAPSVIGIIKIRIDRVHEWIGTGELLTQNNLFPPPAYDYGYDLLLMRDDLFNQSEFSITRYV